MAATPRQITTTAIDVTGTDQATTITARIIGAEGHTPARAVTASGQPVLPLEQYFESAADGAITLELVPTTLMDEQGLKWRLTWPGAAQPLDIEFGPGESTDLGSLIGSTPSAREVPSGGATGDVLAKASGADYDTEWVGPPPTVTANPAGNPTGDLTKLRVGLGNPVLGVRDQIARDAAQAAQHAAAASDTKATAAEIVAANAQSAAGDASTLATAAHNLAATAKNTAETAQATAASAATAAAGADTKAAAAQTAADTAQATATAASTAAGNAQATADTKRTAVQVSQAITDEVKQFARDDTTKIPPAKIDFPDRLAPADIINVQSGRRLDINGKVGLDWIATGIDYTILPGTGIILRVQSDSGADIDLPYTLISKAALDALDPGAGGASSATSGTYIALGPKNAAVGRLGRSNSKELLWAFVTADTVSDGKLDAWGNHQLTGFITDIIETDPDILPTPANIYPVAKAMIKGSTTVTVTPDDDARTLTLTATAGGAAFTPTQANLYSSVKPMLAHSGNTVITFAGDDAHHELDASIGTGKVTGDMLAAAQTLPTIAGSDGGKIVAAKPDRSGWELVDKPSGSSFTPSQANLYASVKAMLATTANAVVTFTGDDTNHELDAAIADGKVVAAMLETLQTMPAPAEGDGGKAVAIKTDLSGWELVNLPSAGTGLPAGWAASQMLRRNSTNDGWDWISTPTFTPSQANLYASVKAMLATTANAVVTFTGDDTNHELDAAIADGKVVAAMLETLQTMPAPAEGDGGKAVAIKTDLSGWELVNLPSVGTGLPAGWAASQMLRRNSTNDGWDWISTPTFTPSQANLYASVKAMLATTTNAVVKVTGDDTNHELDLSIADGKITKTMLEVLQQLPTPAAGDGGKLVGIDSGRTSFELVTKPGDPPAKGTATPKVESGAGSAGTSDKYAPEDHVHPARTLPTYPPTVEANPAGAATTALTKVGITPAGGAQAIYSIASSLGQSNVGLTQIWNEDVTTASTANQFVELTNTTDSLTDWFYLHLAGPGPDERYVLVRLSDITALTAAAAGDAVKNATAVVFNDLLAGNGDLQLGRTAAGALLLASNKTSLALNVAVYRGNQVAGQFVPSQANLYVSVKAMLATTANAVVTVTGDDGNHELDLAIADGKILRAMLEADQQLPGDFGSAGQVLTMNAGATAAVWANASGTSFTPSQTNLYASVKAIFNHSGQTIVTVAGDDSNHELDLSIGNQKVTHDMLADDSVTARAILADQVEGAALIPLQRLPTPAAGDGGKIVALKSDRSGWELKTDDAGSAPTQANVYPLVKSIFKSAVDSSTVEGVAYADDDTAETTALSIKREIIGEDWGNLPVGFAFAVGRVISRSGQWYIAIKAHTKGSTGPDNDSTNWEALTDWTGAYSGTRWYHAGQSALLTSGHVAIAKVDLAPNTTEPTVTDASWWVGGSAVEANKPLQGSEANLTSLEVAGTLYSLNVSEESAFQLTQISEPTTFDGGTAYDTVVAEGETTTGLDIDDCDDVMLFELTYTRTNADLNMSGLVRKSEIPTSQASSPPDGVAYRFQMQGVGGDFAEFFFFDSAGDGSDIYMRFRESSSSITACALTVFNVHGVKGEKGDPGPVYTPDADTIYPVVKPMIKAGDNVTITPDDTDRSLAIGVRLPDEAAPRVYALDSRDVRTVQPPYSYHQISTGFNLDPGSVHTLKGTPGIFGRDNARPGFQNDFNNGRRNSNGVEFSNATAGTTDREINVSVEVQPANERSYSDQESLTLKVYTWGHLKPSPGGQPEPYLTHTKKFNFAGGYQDAFTYDFALTYSAAPRSGEHDSYHLTLEWSTGSSEVVRGVINAVRETYTLPALGSIPKQTWSYHNSRLMPASFDPWIPKELKPLDNAAAAVVTWAVGSPNNTGKNAPNESDKADVTDPLFTFAGSVLDKPFLEAEQDLSRVKLHFAGNAVAGGGDVYLCTRIQGFPAQVLANTSLRSAWTIDYTAQGAMSNQDFYLIDPSGAGVGNPTASWDANPGGPKINNVIDGIFHTAHLKAGINFTPVVTHEFSIDDDELNEAAEAGLLHVIRIFSHDVVAEIPMRGIPRPVPFGSGATNRVRLGTGHLKPQANSGGASTVVWVDAYRDVHGMHFVLKGTNDSNTNAYVSGAEIEYARYLN